MFQANAVGIFGLISVAMCWALAVVLYRVGPTGSVARKLAVLLVVEGMTLATAFYIDYLFVPAVFESSWYPIWSQASNTVHLIGDCAPFVRELLPLVCFCGTEGGFQVA